MTAGLGEQAVANSALDSAVVRALLAPSALAGGIAAAWIARGNVAVLAAMAVLLAAGNGYGKAYSP